MKLLKRKFTEKNIFYSTKFTNSINGTLKIRKDYLTLRFLIIYSFERFFTSWSANASEPRYR